MSNQRAILFLASWYPVNSNPSHGIFIRNHAIALSHFQNVAVVYAYSSEEGPHYKVEHKNVNQNLTEYFIKFPKSGFPLRSLQSFLNFKKAHGVLINYLIQKHIDPIAIQVNVVFPVAVVLSMYKKTFKVKHTVLEHWSGYLKSDGNYTGSIMKYFTKQCIAYAGKVWHISMPQKNAMLLHGLKANYELIYNAVNTTVFKPLKEGGTTEKVQLLHVSSLVEREKNISGTFKVLKKLQDAGYDFNLVVAGGDGVDLYNAKKLAGELKLHNVKFAGNLPPEKIAELMQQSGALILFSNFEGMPVVALEALSCGLPVFATKVGQLPFIIKEEFGGLCDAGDPKEMYQLLENYFEGKYKFNSQAMRQFIMQYASYDAVGKQMNGYYKEVIASVMNTKA
jgi:L-malate glycosyltransferase